MYEINPSQNHSKIYRLGMVSKPSLKFKSHRVTINLGVKADEALCDLAASIAPVYKLVTSMITLSELKNNIPGLGQLLNCKKKSRKLW
jgi:hypothetical protein